MSNPIDNKEIKIDNSISNLVFLWKAKFIDNTVLYQEDGIPFKEVQNRFKELKEFSIHSKELQKCFVVNLEKGYISDCKLDYNDKEIKNNIRLIYFRRHNIELGMSDLKEHNHIIRYFLGFQYLDKNNHNHQIIFEINSDGSFIVRS
jgi:hypothetical protein